MAAINGTPGNLIKESAKVDSALAPTHGNVDPIESTADAPAIADKWLFKFAKALAEGDGDTFVGSFWEHGWWRDKLSFTWDIRSLHGPKLLREAFDFTWKRTAATDFKLNASPPATVVKPYDDVSFIQAHFTFSTKVGKCTGIANLVSVGGDYKAWSVVTVLEDLHKFPELGRAPGIDRKYATWGEQREAEMKEATENLVVLIVGGGHSGLMLAARLKLLGISFLVVEQNAQIGDNWRNRYDNLSLHDPVHIDHMPYLPFPSSWPLFCPAGKLADWLESYVTIMDLNVWTSSKVTKAVYDKAAEGWIVTVQREGQEPTTLKPRQLVISTGLGGSKARYPPPAPGQESFPGTIHHGFQFKSGKPWKGKNVLVVGTGSSGWDISYDLARNDANVTLLQRSPTYVMSISKGIPAFMSPLYWGSNAPPTEIADRITQALPYGAAKFLIKRKVQEVAEMDKDLLDGLASKGLRTWFGEEGAGTYELAIKKGGGLYYDSGCCEYILNGKIKVQPGTIDHFDKSQVTFSDGKKGTYDYVIMATGFDTVKSSLKPIFGDLIDDCDDIWGMDPEGELRGLWRPLGHPRLYAMLDDGIQMSRVNSLLLSRGIVASEYGLSEEPLPRPFSNNTTKA